MSKVSTFKLEGPVPAVFTPMTQDGELDLDKIETYWDYLVNNGISQVYVNGTTGEGPALTLEERTKVVEKWMDVKRQSGGKLKAVVVQVGALNLHDTQTLARHAASVGADAISSVPPLFFKPKSIDYAIKYCRDVASAAPDVPFYFYHVPIMTNIQVNVEDFLREGVKEIPSLVGAKFSSQDLVDLIGCVHIEAPNREDKKFNIVYGNDAVGLHRTDSDITLHRGSYQLMAGVVTGADGGVGSTYNVFPRLILRLLKYTADGSFTEAKREQLKVQQFGRTRNKYEIECGNAVVATKAIMSMIGLDLGPSRAPYSGPSNEVKEKLRKALESIDFFNWRK